MAALAPRSASETTPRCYSRFLLKLISEMILPYLSLMIFKKASRASSTFWFESLPMNYYAINFIPSD